METDRDVVEDPTIRGDKPQRVDAKAGEILLELIVCVEAVAAESTYGDALLASEPFTRLREYYKRLRRD